MIEMKSTVGRRVGNILLFLSLGLGLFPAQAQDLTRHNWYFGASQWGIRYNLSDNAAVLVSDQNPAFGRGGGAVATDQNTGDLLFYTDGTQIYDASHNVMSNGGGLNGNANFNQAAAICPRPGAGNENQYYVFTNNGNIRYNIVDMSQAGNATPPQPPLGAVVDKNVNAGAPATTEAMLVFKSGTSPYRYWLVVQEAGTGNIHLFEIQENGIVSRNVLALPSTVSITSAHFAAHQASGRIAIAPQNPNTNIQIIRFSPATATLSYVQELLNTGFNDTAGQSVYDMEWSPDGTKMFISRYGDAGQPGVFYRYDLSQTNAGPDQVNTQALYRSYGVQIGPDGYIYHLYQETAGGPVYVGRVTNPNDSLLANINYETAPLGRDNFDAYQFPSFSPARVMDFTDTTLLVIGTCYGTPTKFYVDSDPPADSYSWDFGDPNDPDPNNQNYKSPIHEYSQPGVYNVSVDVTVDGTTTTLTQTIQIIQSDTVDLGQDTVICPGETLTMDAGSGGLSYVWNTGDRGQTIQVDSAGYYWVVVDYGTCTSYDGRNVDVYGEQNQRANVWYFGSGAGIDFNQTPAVALTDGQTQAPAGVATISDANGQLLFYTDGNTVYDKNHDIMYNGDNIGGDNQSTQSALIVPFPNDETMFYIFTTRDIWDVTGDHQYILSYSVVDIKQIGHGTVGEVVAKDIPLFTKSTERLAAVQTGFGYWLLAHDFGNNTFRAFPVTEDGIGDPVLTSIGSAHSMSDKSYGEGYMKFSPDGTKVAVALSTPSGNYVELFDFDTTGTLSNYVQIEFPEPFSQYQVYGVEFASNSEKLFVTMNNQGGAQSKLYELMLHNFSKDSIEANMDVIGEESGVNFGALQTGPDGQIYIAMDGQGFVGNFVPVLDSTRYTNYDYQNNRFDLGGGISRLGLPNFVQNFTNQPSAATATVTDGCIGQPSYFYGTGTSIIDEYLWLFGDGGSDTNPETQHTYTRDSVYYVTFRVTNRCGLDTALLDTLTISGNPNEPTLDPVGLICNTNLVLDADNTNTPDLTFLWNTGDTTKTLTVTEPADYSVLIINAAGCTSEDTIQVFDGRPPVDLGPNITVCQNDSVGLNTNMPLGSPPNQYEWTVNGAALPDNNYFISVNTGTPGVYEYTVRVTDGLTGCIGVDTVTVTVNPQPTAVYTVTNSTCGNATGSIVITSPTDDITAEWFNSQGTPFGTGTSLNNAEADVYTLSLRQNVSGCTNSYAIPIVDTDAAFTVSATGNPGCDTDGTIDVTTTVADFTGAEYNLVDEASSQTVLQGPFNQANFTIPNVPVGAVYTLRISAGGCDNSQTGVNVGRSPTVDLTLSPLFDLCSSDAVIDASSSNATDFAWTGPDGFTGTGNSVTVPQSGSYTVTATAAGFCDTTASTSVTVSPSPVVAITPVSDGCADTREIRADVTGGSGNYSYSWDPNHDVGEVISITTSGTYTVTVRDQASSCEATAAADLEVYSPLSVTLTVSQQPCDNDNPVALRTTLDPVQQVTYSWYHNDQLLAGETKDTLFTTEEGNFRVEVTTGHCDATDEISITRAPASGRFLDPKYTICPQPPVDEMVTVTIPQDYIFYRVWRIKPVPVEIFEVSPRVFELQEQGTYLFRMENVYGCWTDDSTYIQEQCLPTIYAPNAFSPSASLPENRTFRIFPTFVDQFEIFIYNRWGELVFHSDDLDFMENSGWDGKKNGKLLEQGTYAYIMRFSGSIAEDVGVIEQSGAIMLLR